MYLRIPHRRLENAKRLAVSHASNRKTMAVDWRGTIDGYSCGLWQHIRSTLGCPLTGAATHASCSLAAQDTDTRSSRYDYLGSKQRRLLLARLYGWMVGWMDRWVQGPSAQFPALLANRK